MLSKKVLMVCVFTICFLAVSSVSAVDCGNNTENMDMLCVGYYANAEINNATSINATISNATTFTDFQKDLDSSNTIVLNHDIVLTNNESGQFCDGLTIHNDTSLSNSTKEVIIDARGHTIDAISKARIFNVEKGVVLYLANAVLTNGFTIGDGAAICSLGDVICINCTIKDNVACGSGGGIMANEISLINSNVSDNFALKAGGGASALGNLYCFNSTCHKNMAHAGGGFISLLKMFISYSIIDGNKALDGNGGGINTRAICTDHTLYSNNFANGNGGAIYIDPYNI